MNRVNSLLPTTRAAARRISLRASNRRRPLSSAALLSTSQPLHAAEIRQAHPRGAYYDILLTSPPPYSAVKSEGPPSTAKPVPTSLKPSPVPVPTSSSPSSSTPQAAAASTSEKPTVEPKSKTASERARIVFGSRLAGPVQRAERLAQMRDRSQMIAGVLVPPRPEEPENCCMSGCVDCVWDRYRDEMEGWAHASAEASRRLKAQEGGVAAAIVAGAGGVSSHVSSATSMDDDGGGSNTNWDTAPPPPPPGPEPDKGESDFWDDELYKSLPVGIREFMKQEKRLKHKHLREGTMGG